MVQSRVETNQAKQKLRLACDNCHQAKVRCSGESTCRRCLERDLECRYSLATRAGKPKGSRNRKTLERLNRMREKLDRAEQERAVTSQNTFCSIDGSELSPVWHCDASWSPGSSCQTDLGQVVDIGMNSLWSGSDGFSSFGPLSDAGDASSMEIIDTFNLAPEMSTETMGPFLAADEDGGERFCMAASGPGVADTNLDPSLFSVPTKPPNHCDIATSKDTCVFAKGPGSQHLLPAFPSQEKLCTEAGDSNTCRRSQVLEKSCHCVENQVKVVGRLFQSGLSSENQRLDVGLDCATTALSSCQKFLDCESCEKDSISTFITLSAIRLVFRCFGGLIFHICFSQFPSDSMPLKLGDYQVTQEEGDAIKTVLIRQVLLRGSDTLSKFGQLLDRSAEANTSLAQTSDQTSITHESKEISYPTPPDIFLIQEDNEDQISASPIASSQPNSFSLAVIGTLSGQDVEYLRHETKLLEGVLQSFIQSLSDRS